VLHIRPFIGIICTRSPLPAQ